MVKEGACVLRCRWAGVRRMVGLCWRAAEAVWVYTNCYAGLFSPIWGCTRGVDKPSIFAHFLTVPEASLKLHSLRDSKGQLSCATCA